MDNASSKWLRYERNYIFPADYSWNILTDELYRKRGKFFKTNEADSTLLFLNPDDKFVYIYNQIKEKYTGVVRENLMAYTFCDAGGALRSVGFTQKIEAILADYYAQPGYPEFKEEVKTVELDRRRKWNTTNAPVFTLMDITGNLFNNEQIKGKIAVLDFWFTGCTGCVQMAPALRKLEAQFSNDTNIVFISVSVDKDKNRWLKSVAQGKYTSAGGTQLYTEGKGQQHDLIKKLLIESYPTLEIIDQNGFLLKADKRKVDPRFDNGKALTALLKKTNGNTT